MSKVVGQQSPRSQMPALLPALARTLLGILLFMLIVLSAGGIAAKPLFAQEPVNYQYDIAPPPGASEQFGTNVMVLANGNVVLTDPGFDLGAASNVGAVFLYEGASLATPPYTPNLISTLTGSTTGDGVGSYILRVGNGNFIVGSSMWDRGGVVDAGAVTWVDGEIGLDGEVSAANSLVGSTANDRVGVLAFVLPNGNYVLVSPIWDNEGVWDAGAITWAHGASGIAGEIDSSNSLVATADDSYLGTRREGSSLRVMYTVLTNGHVVVSSPEWNYGAGASTWIDKDTGRVGAIDVSNSVVGDASGRRVGSGGVTALTNGNYVVNSDDYWVSGTPNYVATWGDGVNGSALVVAGATNSIYGEYIPNAISRGGTTALSNGNYVVTVPGWSGTGVYQGAARWAKGDGSTVGGMNVSNSLYGGNSDQIGSYGVLPLANGNYVVNSPGWQGTGALTWADGDTGITGPVSIANSLVGNRPSDGLGLSGLIALPNGNYVVNHKYFQALGDDDISGAVVWVDGDTGLTGNITTANSLHGSPRYDLVGSGGVSVLSNGDYVVASPGWNDSRGALTLVDGDTGLVGEVSAANSFVGTNEYDNVASLGVGVLTNGNYVVASGTSPNGWITWFDGSLPATGSPDSSNSFAVADLAYAGAAIVTPLSSGNYILGNSALPVDGLSYVGGVRWVSGGAPLIGTMDKTNSVVGTEEWNEVTLGSVTDLGNDKAIVFSERSSNNSIQNAGALTLIRAGGQGSISPLNSVQGTRADGSTTLVWSYSHTPEYLVVGRPADNLATVMLPEISGYVLNVSSMAGGRVTSDSGGINCPRNCVAGFPAGINVTLTAIPGAGEVFNGWGGACSGALPTCTLPMGQAHNVTANFVATQIINVTKAGTGSGTVVSNPAGINCGSICADTFDQGESVTLTAAPAGGNLFAGWSGACTGTSLTCSFTVGVDAIEVTATFNAQPPAGNKTLNVAKSGTGGGTVTSAPAGITCGSTCSANFANNTTVTLTASAAEGSVFSGWNGDCSGTATTCVLTMSANRSATAIFTASPAGSHLLTVSKAGAGSGSVTSNPDGINCGALCSATFANNTAVLLTATPASGSFLVGWSGACSGSSSTCSITMSEALAATATFAPSGGSNVDVDITPSDPEGGTVKVEVLGAQVHSTEVFSLAALLESYPVGTTLKLTAQPNEGFTFDGWTGDLTGITNPATVTVTKALQIGAIFTEEDPSGGTPTVWLPMIDR